MQSLPYFRWFPKDFDSDDHVRSMEDCELGLYLRCLNHSWVNDGLPSEPDEIRRRFRDNEKDFDTKWKRVAPCFPISEDGRRRNPRQEKERSEVIEKGKRARDAARKRWDANASDSDASAYPVALRSHSATHCVRNARASESESESSEEVKLTNKENISTREKAFEAWWINYPLKKAKKDAEKAWTKEPNKAAMSEGLARQLPGMLKNPKYIPYAASWIRGRRWEDESSLGSLSKNDKPRVIACELCGDSGIVAVKGPGGMVARCSCARGQLPGLVVPQAEEIDSTPF